MKKLLYLFAGGLIALATTQPIAAQTPAPTWSGQITYEGIHKIDPASLKFLDDNGELMKPDDPNFPKDIPANRMSEQKVLINGAYARVTGNNYVMPQVGKLVPFTERTFVDLVALKKVTVVTVGKEADAKAYRAEAALRRLDGWQLTDQTQKIAGYVCRKATVPYKGETYTVWITTDLPITYSPIQELTPDNGAVLLIEGRKEQYRATKITKTAPDPSVMQPGTAQLVTPDQLTEIRQKAIADFEEKHRRVGQGG